MEQGCYKQKCSDHNILFKQPVIALQRNHCQADTFLILCKCKIVIKLYTTDLLFTSIYIQYFEIKKHIQIKNMKKYKLRFKIRGNIFVRNARIVK